MVFSNHHNTIKLMKSIVISEINIDNFGKFQITKMSFRGGGGRGGGRGFGGGRGGFGGRGGRGGRRCGGEGGRRVSMRVKKRTQA